MAIPVLFRYDNDHLQTNDPVFAILPTESVIFQDNIFSYDNIRTRMKNSRKATAKEAIPIYDRLKARGYNLIITDKLKRKNYE